jgi:hypothetical protein
VIFSPEIRNVEDLLKLNADEHDISLLASIDYKRRRGKWGDWVIDESSDTPSGHKFQLRNRVFSIDITLEHISYFIEVYCSCLRDLTDDEVRRLLRELFYEPQLASKCISLDPLQGMTDLRMPRLELRPDKYTTYPMRKPLHEAS